MRITKKIAFFLLLTASIALLSAAQSPVHLSDLQLEKGEAAVWYLFHAGWAVRTAHTLVIFDTLVETGETDKLSLSDGGIDPDEIKDLNVYVFISHSHGDHFDEKILEWQKTIPNITYVFGWFAPETEGHVAFGRERTSKAIGPMKVKNIYHDFDNIPESAFLIEVDGLNIFYSGDHGNSAGALNPVYKDNIDYMSQQSDRFDLVFLSIFGSPTYEGELYVIEKFRPLIMLPMHYGGRESGAKSFVELARPKFPNSKFWYPLKKGDRFIYKNGEIFPLK